MTVEFFFKIINELVNTDPIDNDWYLIQLCEDVSVHRNENEHSVNVFFGGKYETLIFINFNQAWRQYRQRCFDLGLEYLPMSVILPMIENHVAFIGKMKAKRINGKIRRCIVLKAEPLIEWVNS